ncbi:flagellar basal-body rod protein FlgF [Halomonas sp. ISL-60]|uniref:flagellar basal-body rod protein FlgF n=1 Tax=Halomonas sp. ISL-56 TaxID=2819149 RepID=UPI001BEA399A|nr:flagellar basal-body rod protein FlgF [Halomonas sp. ISL-56]MBT2774214.1 flagellar basal-body rod protein FlgF [Halomonas sp. ISL-60]MBT2800407.1 flagellar basal-body rod protein FlgF [Halomonas sp. ISL-56]
MDRMLYTAMSGAKNSMDQQSVVSNNLSNVTTTGFRAQLQAARSVPVQGEALLATRTSAVTTTPGSDFSQGPVEYTGRTLDVAMQDDAWMAVQADDGTETYTRRGDLQIDNDGVLLSVGRPVMGEGGPIAVPQGAQISIGADGTISAIPEGVGPEALVEVGRIKLVTPEGGELTRGEDGLFRAPPNEEGEPGVLPADENAKLVSGALEGSNVSAIDAMVSMIDVARRYDMQMKVLSTADENAQRANGILSIQG